MPRVTHVTFVDGQNADTVPAEVLIGKIRDLEKEINELATLEVESSGIEKMISQKRISMKAIVNLLDGKKI